MSSGELESLLREAAVCLDKVLQDNPNLAWKRFGIRFHLPDEPHGAAGIVKDNGILHD